MKKIKSSEKAKTLSELCGVNTNSFTEFLKNKNRVLSQMDSEANSRAKAVVDQAMAWAS